MTLPSEEVRALKRTKEFLRDISTGPRMPMKELRERARSCLHHYPFDLHIEERWANDVCECGNDRQFCKGCESPTLTTEPVEYNE